MYQDRLMLDPRTKLQIKDALYSFLYTPVLKRFKTRMDALIIRNAMIQGLTHMSFRYQGEVHSCDVTTTPKKSNNLAPELRATMDEYLEEQKELNELEIPYVLGFINKVLNSSNELHDYLRVLPQSVHSPIQTLINTCPCRAKSLTDEQVLALKGDKHSIDLIKQRLFSNLLH